MRSRLISVLLAFLLFWSGLAGQEVPRADVAGLAGLAQQERLADRASMPHEQPGSVDHHHLDDRPLQVHGDSTSESPAIMPAVLSSRRLQITERHAGAHGVATAAPYLDGPLRPPRPVDPAA